ncbi:MAG TPA: TlpA disulfide reductase family protein [Anaerolineales bacterium]|jgi:cytochrome c biogenesis protein CcmG/thiol:disulfide interchange protein DsbE|nr:TlpA disulfide reductase family protein [Anaerolineales bacterium]
MTDLETTSPSSETSALPSPDTKRIAIFGMSLSLGALIAWTALLALLIILAFGLMRSQKGPVSKGETAPAFSLTTFDGQQINSSELNGKVLVVNFWASWCQPCEQEAAELEAAWNYYKPRGDVVFLGVDYVDTEPEAMAYLNKFNISYPNGPDLGTRISQAYRIRGVPETFFINRDGKLSYFQKGPFTSMSEIVSVIDPLLEP